MKRGLPAEYLDHAKDCSDCSCPLVDAADYGTPRTERAVEEWHAARDSGAEEARPTDADASGRTNMVTGYALIALSILLLVGSWMAASVTSGGSYFIAIGPFAYGLVRLSRASQQRSRAKPRAGTPYR